MNQMLPLKMIGKLKTRKKLYELYRLRLPLKHAANGSASGSLVIGDVPFLLGPDF